MIYLFLIMFLNLILVGFLVFYCRYGGSLQASTDMVMPTNFHDLKMSKIWKENFASLRNDPFEDYFWKKPSA